MFINFRLIIPISCREKNIINIPAIILKIFELSKKNLPAKDAVQPKDIKIIEKPKVKKNVFKTINFLFFSAILSKEVPDIYEI